jgi:hypothetical protein
MSRTTPEGERFGGCRRTTEQALGTKIFIRVRPVNFITCTGDFPTRALLDGGVQKARVPDEWNDNSGTIYQIYSQSVLDETDIADVFSGITRGSSHAISPPTEHDFHLPAAEHV